MNHSEFQHFGEDLQFVLSILAHIFILFCMLYVLAHIKSVTYWLGLTQNPSNTSVRKVANWKELLGYKKK